MARIGYRVCWRAAQRLRCGTAAAWRRHSSLSTNGGTHGYHEGTCPFQLLTGTQKKMLRRLNNTSFSPTVKVATGT